MVTGMSGPQFSLVAYKEVLSLHFLSAWTEQERGLQQRKKIMRNCKSALSKTRCKEGKILILTLDSLNSSWSSSPTRQSAKLHLHKHLRVIPVLFLFTISFYNLPIRCNILVFYLQLLSHIPPVQFLASPSPASPPPTTYPNNIFLLLKLLL